MPRIISAQVALVSWSTRNFHDGLGDGEGSVVDDIDKLKAAALFHRNIFQFPDGGFQEAGALVPSAAFTMDQLRT